MKKIVILLLGLFLHGFIVSAQDVQFTASAPKLVELGEQFQLVFTANKKGAGVRFRETEDFDLVMGPMNGQQISTVVVNGKSTTNQSFTYTYLLAAKKEGKFELPAATIVIDGKEYSSNSVNIEVVKGSGRNATQRRGSSYRQNSQEDREENDASVTMDNLFARINVSRRSLYVGEPLVADMKIYTTTNLTNIAAVQPSSFSGFLVEDLPMPNRISLQREKYNDKIYSTAHLDKKLLYPQHSGTLQIDPFSVDCIVTSGAESEWDAFFGNVHSQKYTRKSVPVTIEVKELPAGKPLGFSGAVGSISMTTSVSTTSLKANEAITYTVTYKGRGNLKLLNAPSITFPHEFEVYDPKENKNISADENGESGVVKYEYLIIPRYAGEYTIPSLDFSYFDPKTEKYVTVNGQEYTIEVEKGNGTESAVSPQGGVQSFAKEDIRTVGEDIRFIKTGDLHLRKAGNRFYGTWMMYVAYILPLLLIVIGFFVNRKMIEANADIAKVRNKTANKVAGRRLKMAAQAMRTHNKETFYEEVLKSMWAYISYKLNIDPAELNRDNVSDKLNNRGVDPAITTKFIEILDTCEYARYAPESGSEHGMEKVYQDSVDVITKMEKNIK